MATAFGYKIWNNTVDTKKMIQVDFYCNSKKKSYFVTRLLEEF